VLILAVALICFTPGLTTISTIDRDEARFAQASKQMVASGDYVTPRYQNELRAKKPIGIYWMQAAAAHLFGDGHISSYRIPSLLGGVLLVGLTAGFARLILPRHEALFAGLFMATSMVLVVESHLAKTDAMLAATVAAQQIIMWRIQKLDHAGHYISGKYAVLFWAAMAMAILIKGPIGPVVAIMTALFVIVAGRQWQGGAWRWILTLRPLLGLIILTVMILPWVMLVMNATDGVFLSKAIKTDLLPKLQSGQESHGAPPLTHLALVMVTFWPGSLFLARAVVAVKSRWREPNILFLLGWLVPFWIIIELTPTKLPQYTLPVFAALAILAMLGLHQSLPDARPSLPKPQDHHASAKKWHAIIWRNIKRLSLARSLIIIWEWAVMGIGPLLAIAVLYVTTFTHGNRMAAFIMMIAACGVSAAGFYWHRGGKSRAAAGMVAGAIVFYVLLLGVILPSLESIRLAPRIKAQIDLMTPPPRLITAAGYHEPSLVFELGTDTLLFSPREAAFFMAETDHGLALIERRGDAEFRQMAAQIGITVKAVTAIKGYNISRGQDVEILFYRRLDY
jgi:4-amino-4-deoxy-L-arabinose transferase-like glycosyltransferase